MSASSNHQIITHSRQEISNISIVHTIVDYHSFGINTAKNEEDVIRMHFGMKGNYDFTYKELGASYQLTGPHNNIMYSDGLEIEVTNKSKRIETFGINFAPELFVDLAQNGTDALKKMAEKVMKKESAVLSHNWKPTNFKIQQVIKDILTSSFTDELKDLFLLSKSIELLVLQAELYENEPKHLHQKSTDDLNKIIAAKDILDTHMDQPPTISELAKLVELNEYKLKKGFRDQMGLTVFGYIHKSRITMAKKLLLDTSKSAKEIAYETGYSSPQHFSKAFKAEFGFSPNSIRKNPDCTTN